MIQPEQQQHGEFVGGVGGVGGLHQLPISSSLGLDLQLTGAGSILELFSLSVSVNFTLYISVFAVLILCCSHFSGNSFLCA